MDDRDPASLSDEELDKALQGDLPIGGEGDEPVVPPADDEVEEEIEDDVTPPAEDEEDDPKPPAEDEPKPPSRRETLRIQQILERQKQAGERANPQPRQTRQDALNYEEELDASPEVLQRLKADREAAEQSRYDEGLRQAQGYEWRTLLHVDAPQVEGKYAYLDKNNSEAFHPALADSLSQWYLQMSGFDNNTGLPANPGMRWGEFVDGINELAEEIAAQKIEKQTQNIRKQAAGTGIRPNGAATKLNLNKAPDQMSDEELNAYLKTQNLA